MGKIGIKNHGYLTAIDLCCAFKCQSRVSRVFMTHYLGDFCPDFGVPINSTHQIFKNVFWVKKKKSVLYTVKYGKWKNGFVNDNILSETTSCFCSCA